MYIFLFVLFLVVAFLSFLEDSINERNRWCILAVMIPFMIFAATFKDVSVVADSEAYESMFYDNDNPLVEIATEPTYVYLSRLVLMFNGGIACMFFVYAMISIPTKMWAIGKMTPYFFSALVIYIPVYYELHDLVQIRAAAAGAMLMLTIYNYVVGNKKNMLLSFVVAILFHYSSISFLPVLLFGKYMTGKRTRNTLAIVVPIGFILYLTHRDLFSLMTFSSIGAKVEYYKDSAEIGGNWSEMLAPYKNLYFLIKCAFLYLYIFYFDFLKRQSKYFTFICVIEAGSLFWLLSMATIPVVATRISDLYGIIDAIFFTFVFYIVEPKIAVRICIIAVGLYMYVYNMLNSNYFG